ncbi:MAG: iron ABC transporter permease [Flavobacteriales bacterium]|nr:MAG: iron ABC transporter permease [Flavobacteriales bacterium]
MMLRGWANALAVLLCLPLLVVALSPLFLEAPQWSFVGGAFLWEHLGGSLELAFGTLLLALVFGVGAAWVVSVFDFPGRRVISWLFVLPLALPTYIAALAFAGLLGPTGTWTVFLREHMGIEVDVMTMPGLCMVLALVLFPYVYVPARAAFSGGLSDALEASRTLGAGPWRRFVSVGLPLARPAIAGGGLLVLMETLNDYGAVKYYGLHTITTGIFRAWGGLYDRGSAMRLAVLLVVLVITLIVVERMLRRRGLRTTDHRPLTRLTLSGPRRILVLIVCSLLVLMSLVVPIGALSIDALSVPGAHLLPELFSATLNTLHVGAWAAGFTLLVALLLAWKARQQQGRESRLGQLAELGYVVPGAVIAVGAMALAGLLDRAVGIVGTASGLALIGSLPLLVYAFGARFMAVAAQPIKAGSAQQPMLLDEAARTLGVPASRTFLRVNLPLLRPALVAAALLTALEVMKELPLTLIMRPFDFDTLSTTVHEYARIEQTREAALPALVIVLCALLPVLLLHRLHDKRRG